MLGEWGSGKALFPNEVFPSTPLRTRRWAKRTSYSCRATPFPRLYCLHLVAEMGMGRRNRRGGKAWVLYAYNTRVYFPHAFSPRPQPHPGGLARRSLLRSRGAFPHDYSPSPFRGVATPHDQHCKGGGGTSEGTLN